MNLPEFDELVALAETRPEELDRIRREMVERIIAQSANEDVQRRLRGLQFRIDAKVRLAKTPLAACILISQMMHESLFELRERLMYKDRLRSALRRVNGETAKVISIDEARRRRAAR